MAKALIVTFLFCVAVAAAATEGTTGKQTTTPPTPSTSTTKAAIATLKPPTPVPASTGTPPTESPSTGTLPTQSPPTQSPSTKSPPTGSPPTGSPPTGSPPTGSPPTGSPPTGSPPTGSPPTGSPPTGSPPTGSPPTGGPSVSPNTGSSQTNAPSTAPVPATTKPPGACASSPCPARSTCEERFNQSFTCLCRPGEVFNGQYCLRTKVFPGELVWKKEFQPQMADKTSQIFWDTSSDIADEVGEQFRDKGYLTITVLELRKKETKERSSNIEASVQIVFQPNAEITEDDVTTTVEGIPLAGSFNVWFRHGTTGVKCQDFSQDFNSEDVLRNLVIAKSLCEFDSCDSSSTTCQPAPGSFTCSCKDGFIETDYSGNLCVAQCPSGQQAENGECKPCGFGKTGFNCKDNTLLIVVIVCIILGVVLIAVLIALPFVVKKSKKKSSKRTDEDIGKPYQSHSIAKAPLSDSNGNSNNFSAPVREPTNSLANSGAPRIPRATANSNWDNRTNLEMTPASSRQNLIPSGMNSRFNDNQDDMYSFSQNRPKSHHFDEIQPNSNPYSQNRASNPYAQIRGQTNPYYN